MPANIKYFLCSLLYTKVTEKEEIIYNEEVSRPETRKKPFFVIH